MGTKSLALVDSRTRAHRSSHPAEWTAQLIVGVRALRQMVSDAAGPGESSPSGATRTFGSAHEARALPAGDASDHKGAITETEAQSRH